MNLHYKLIVASSIVLSTMATSNLITKVPEVGKIAASNTMFGFDLFRECGQKLRNENLFISPFSISTALALTHIGARGKTAEEMKRVLHWSTDEVLAKGYGAYLPLLKESANLSAPGYVLVGAQRIYVRNNFPVKPEFNAVATQQYNSDAKSADFAANPDGERIAINNWVSEQTRNKVKDLLPRGSISGMVAMVLIQATYFKGKWMHQFDPKRTKKADFFAPQGKIQVDMMSMERDLHYCLNDELKCSAVELPYLSNKPGDNHHDLSMVILLPEDKNGLESLEAALTHDMLTKIRKSMHSVKVNLQLPRFSMESSLQLKESLAKLGMPTAFSTTSDFTGIADAELYIDEVYHKAVVEVNEEGSEAAAATGVVMMMRSLPIIRPFIADHPFIFFIIDNRADVVLFMGRVVNPVPSASGCKEEL